MDRVTCEEMFRRLDDYVDRELGPEEIQLVEEHLEDCTNCAAEYAFEASVIRQLRAKLRHIDVPSDLLERVSRSLRKRTNNKSNQRSD